MSEKLPIRMLHDRRSNGGIVVLATAALGKRLAMERIEEGQTGPYL